MILVFQTCSTLEDGAAVQLDIRGNVGERVSSVWDKVIVTCSIAKWRDIIGSWTYSSEMLQCHLGQERIETLEVNLIA